MGKKRVVGGERVTRNRISPKMNKVVAESREGIVFHLGGAVSAISTALFDARFVGDDVALVAWLENLQVSLEAVHDYAAQKIKGVR